eukprot:CAMPEP_0183294730 /NCGR_PEP_ID=MMETSP0160_2-20130417/2947_1 /TAXON_ID=2839 ORGANISM="Odontella Sinensis, Strain Grunow 1884" /NCGR_SAMPLE_ID=MMETSP0160_2 /ASSEMBLY_ACC=CAM_ASM_000250 /LENGTH=95 /DNA_ID=CAMNT_0025456091 /DNA_START=103 /DNA_END=386 /DNA_ORIENTATION=-
MTRFFLFLMLAVATTAQNGIRGQRRRVPKGSIIESAFMREAAADQEDVDFWDRELGGRGSNSKGKGKGKGKGGKGGSKSKSKSKGKGKGKGGSKS